MDYKQTVAIIGAGIGGLTAAALLARKGYNVHVFERSNAVGGKMGRLQHNGFSFDTGPSVITMPFVLENFFRQMGTALAEHVTLVPVDPACRYRWPDGSVLHLPFALSEIPSAIARLSASDGPAAERYLRRARELYERTKDIFLFSPFEGFREFIRPRNLRLLPLVPSLQAHRQLHDIHRSTFRDPRIVQLFDRFATYSGSSPFRAPGTLMIIPWVEMGYGAWYPMGGVHTIAQALFNLAQEAGAAVHLSTGVRKICTTNNNTVSGVVLDNGETVHANCVISNADVHRTLTSLLGEHNKAPYQPSHGAVVHLLATHETHSDLAHHNVFFSSDYQTEFRIIEEGRLPDDATVYVSRSCATDPSQAPSGSENWFVLRIIQGSYDSAITPKGWDAIPDVVVRQTRNQFTPVATTVMSEPLYGEASNSMFSIFRRHGNTSRAYRNLWYVGGTVHPGGGVPLVVLSGTIVANTIMNTLHH